MQEKNEKQIINLINSDQILIGRKDIQVHFAGKRQVLSTSVLNGGYSETLNAVFNFDEKSDEDHSCRMDESTYEEHLSNIAEVNLGLNPEYVSGLSTACNMSSYSLKQRSFLLKDGYPLIVTALVTGGIDKNGARAGDYSGWAELAGEYYQVDPDDMNAKSNIGTINIFLHVNARLTPGCMARALVMATEAKTAAVSELLCPSLYSNGIATGSGTDGTIIIADAESNEVLTHAGKDCKFGEMIGTVVKETVKEAIGKQTCVTPSTQHSVLARLGRFGVTVLMLNDMIGKNGYSIDQNTLLMRCQSDYWTVEASILAHLLDQVEWGMLSEKELLHYYDLKEISDCKDVKSMVLVHWLNRLLH